MWRVVYKIKYSDMRYKRSYFKLFVQFISGLSIFLSIPLRKLYFVLINPSEDVFILKVVLIASIIIFIILSIYNAIVILNFTPKAILEINIGDNKIEYSFGNNNENIIIDINDISLIKSYFCYTGWLFGYSVLFYRIDNKIKKISIPSSIIYNFKTKFKQMNLRIEYVGTFVFSKGIYPNNTN
jgi:hypothetical protein